MEYDQRKQVARHYNERAGFVGCRDRGGRVFNHSVRGRVLEQHTAQVHRVVVDIGFIPDMNGEADACGASAHHTDRLWMTAIAHKEAELLALGCGFTHRHGFGGGAGFVEQR